MKFILGIAVIQFGILILWISYTGGVAGDPSAGEKRIGWAVLVSCMAVAAFLFYK